MRTYLILKEKARQYAADAEIQAALVDAGVDQLARPSVGAYSRAEVDGLRAEQHDPDALGAREVRNERLDQLVTDLLLGLFAVRSRGGGGPPATPAAR